MNAREILKQWLQDNGYDGLYNEFAECGCFIDDLAPCGCLHELDCKAGYKCKIKSEFGGAPIYGICRSKEEEKRCLKS